MICIGTYVCMAGEFFGPIPFLLQIFIKAVGILHAFHVAPCPRIAIPIPGTANAITTFETSRREALLTQAMKQIETRETGADDDDINGNTARRPIG